MLKLSHKNLDVWRLSVNFVTSIYQLTENFPKSELYGIVSQIRRAAVSIASNIAEGASRISSKEKTRFYVVARSSLVEVDTQLEIAMRLEYCSDKNLKKISEQLNHLFAMLSNMIGKRER
jgi:four helix bundle protein